MAKKLLPRKQGEKEVSAIKYTLSVSFVPGKLSERDTRRASSPHSPSHAGGRQLGPVRSYHASTSDRTVQVPLWLCTSAHISACGEQQQSRIIFSAWRGFAWTRAQFTRVMYHMLEQQRAMAFNNRTVISLGSQGGSYKTGYRTCIETLRITYEPSSCV